MPCANADTPASLLTQDAAEAAVLCLVNEARVANGVPALTLNLKLRAAARQHANDARTIKWWHDPGADPHVNPITDTTPGERIKAADYCPGEALPPMNENAYDAWYQGGPQYQAGTTPQAAVEWWLNSPGHRATMLDPVYKETGIAVVLGVAGRGEEFERSEGAIFVETFGGCAIVEPANLGEVWAWGRNDGGQLGDGTTTDRHTAVHLQTIPDIASLSAGRSHSFALQNDGSVLVWGFNPLGQLGDGTTTNRPAPVPLTALSDVAGVDAGSAHSVAVLTDGLVLAWGANHKGQLGDGTTTDRPTPEKVLGLDEVTAISAGFHFNLALKVDGTVWAWGMNNWGQLGDGTNDDRSTPVQVGELGEVMAISAGFEHALALKRDGSVWGWGANHSGQLGDSSLIARRTPVQVHMPASLSGPIVAIAAGGFHSLALEQNERMWTWGGNAYGQLGYGDTTGYYWLPVRPVNMYGVSAIAAGFGHSLALKRDGSVWAWGMNGYGGQLGDDSIIDRSLPRQVMGIPPIQRIAAGSFHSLVT